MLDVSYYTPEGSMLNCDPTESSEVFTFWSVEPPFPGRRLRYHLGQLAMIRQMQLMAKRGQHVRAALCDAFHLMPALYENPPGSGTQGRSAHQDVEVPRLFVSTLAGDGITACAMSELICEELGLGTPGFQRLRDAVALASLHFQDAMLRYPGWGQLREALGPFRGCRASAAVSPDLGRFVAHLQKELNISIAKHILLATAYAFGARPTWWNAAWVSYFTAFLACRHARKPLVILEADRSAYAWLTMTALFLMVRVQQPSGVPSAWPPFGVLAPLPAADGVGPMMLARRRGCIFLDAPHSELVDNLLLSHESARTEYYRAFVGPNVPDSRARHLANATADCLVDARRRLPGTLLRRARNPFWVSWCWLRRPAIVAKILWQIVRWRLGLGHG